MLSLILSGVGIFSILMIILFGFLLGILLPIIAIVDIVRSRINENDKVVWIIIIIFIPILGSILYFLLGQNRRY
ncbi:MAG: PLDc N-terminal domain-containing protein [Bacteroidales bacterium]